MSEEKKNAGVFRIAWILVGVALTLGVLEGEGFYKREMAKRTAMTYMQAVIDNDTKTLREVTTPEYMTVSQPRGWVSAFRTLVGAKPPEVVGVTESKLQEDGSVQVFVKLQTGEASRTEGLLVRKTAEGWRVSGRTR